MQNTDDVLRRMHRAAMRALQESESLPAGIGAVLQAVCTHLGWAGGEYWEIGTGRASVDRLALWCPPDLTGSPLGDPPSGPRDGPWPDPPPGPRAEREELSLPANGLPGAVWASDGEIWIGDLATAAGDPQRAQLARESGLRIAITVPVTSEDHCGVLLFIARELAEPSAALIFALQSIGAHVGQFVDCCRSRTRPHPTEAMAGARDTAISASAAKTSFLATMSREIRTPMSTVVGMTDLLLDTALDTRQQEYVQTVRTSSDALLAVLNDFLDFSRLEAGELELVDQPFELRRCVEDSLARVAPAATGLDLAWHVDANCPRFVVGDVNRLRQVLDKLVGNAVKFTQDGDVLLSVTVADTEEDGDVVLSFSVRDTGIGIPEEQMDQLFTSFDQAARVHGRSGLGLAISRAIVRSMGGDLAVTSTVGVGSRFSFDLRLARCTDPPAGLADQHGPGEAVDLSGYRALVVDDSDTNRRMLRVQLEAWGVSCIAVSSPRGALAVLGEGSGFDVAILDMHMPETDGAQLAAQIRRMPAGENLPLVLLTGLASKPHASQVDLFSGFHAKPIEAGALRLMLGQILAQRRPGTSIPAARRRSTPS